MHRIFEYVKEHPLTLVLVLGVGILVIVLFSGGSSGGTVVAAGAAGPDDADVAAQTALAQTQIQASASLTGAANQQSFQLAEDQINANSAAYTSNLGATVSLSGIDAQKDVQLAGISSQVQIADLQNQSNLAQAQVYQSIFTSQQQTQQNQDNDAAAVAINGQNVQGSIALAPYTTIDTLANNGAIGNLTGTKDAYLNLPGLQVGRATNFTPAGATAGQPNAFAQFAGGLVGGLAGAAFG